MYAFQELTDESSRILDEYKGLISSSEDAKITVRNNTKINVTPPHEK